MMTTTTTTATTTTTTTRRRKCAASCSSSCGADGAPHPLKVFRCPLQLLVQFRDHAPVSSVPAGGTSGVCEACRIVHAGAARGHVGAVLGRDGVLLGGRELLLLQLLLLLFVVVVVVVGAFLIR
jgi:hypothetical protein